MLEVNSVVVEHRHRQSMFSRMSARQSSAIRALDAVTLQLGARETLGLIGESGSGKTTLGRAIIGLQPVADGSILFHGRELVGLNDREYRPVRRQMAMIFQDPVASLSPRKTVGALLFEPYLIHGVHADAGSARVDALLETVGLDPGLARAYPHQLSGGQARRVGIARAIALNPQLIIADEPTAGLDVSVQGEVINLMIELQERTAVSYLFITHNLALARQSCDRLAILYRGMLCEIGPTEAILSSPAHPYTRRLVASVSTAPHAEVMDTTDRAIPSAVATRPPGCLFSDRCDSGDDRCRALRPPAIPMADGRSVSCHHPVDPGED